MATLLASCGEDEELLPGDDAEQIVANLESVEALATSGRCDEAEGAIDDVAAQVESLPGSVSERLRSNLLDGVARLHQVVAENCADQEAAQDEEAEAAADADALDEEAGDPAGDSPDQAEGGDEAQEGGREPTDGEGDDAGAGDQDEGEAGGGDRGPPEPGGDDSGDGAGDPQTPGANPDPDESGGVAPGQGDVPDEGGQ